MSTVGLSFGSATSGTGFDVASTVTSILAIESAVETPWKAHLTSLQAQDTAFTTLGTNLSALSTALSSLTAFDGVTASKEGSSSDTSTVSLSSASSSAVAGSHTVLVTSLAATSSQYSDSISSASDTLSGSLTLQVGSSGTSQTITLDSSSNTLATLASTINSGSYGVTASVVTDTQGSRLSLVSKTSGAAGEITATSNLSDSTSSTSVAFNTGTTGRDAQLTVDGLATTSASNTVTGAIPGVTFQLLQASSSTVQVEIANDNSSVVSAFQSLVTAYNAVVANIKTQEGKDSSGTAEPLFGNPSLALVQTQLASALSTGAASGSIKNISQLGLSVGTDGTLTLDSTTLQSTLNSDFQDVAGFLQGTGSFGLTFSNTLNGLSSTNTQGVVALALSENSTAEAGINADLTTEDARVADDKTRLTTELTTANEILQSIPSQLSEQDELYAAITGYNTK